MKKILVIDGNSIINRAFYGVRPLTTKSGKNTNAIFGMINIISKQMEDIKPDYAVAAFDIKAPTFRHKAYEHYKEGRHPTPEELLSQFPDAKECLTLMGIHVMELEGYEADDIQGTVASLAHSAEDTESYVLSGDRDLLQLIDDKITVLLATNKETLKMQRSQFLEKYGIDPSQFIDMKALMGDSSDNIPGVMGIGEKTAATLIQNFGTLDGIYKNIEDKRIPKGVREKLLKDKDNAYLSKFLAKIETRAPIEKKLEELKYVGIDKEGLYKKFTELELNSFIVKFGLKHNSDNGEALKKAERKDFKTADAAEIINCVKDKFSLQSVEDSLYIYNGRENFKFDGDITEIGKIFDACEIICYDGKAFWHFLDKRGVNVSEKTKFLDISVYAYLLNPGSGSAGIPALSSMFLGETIDEEIPCPELLWKLEDTLRKKITEDELLYILDELEIPLINILASMEKIGFKINSSGMIEFRDALDELARELTERIYVLAGEEFNINSPKQLGELLFVKLGLPFKKKKTKNGYSTDAETLEELRPYSPIIDEILEYRQVTKLKSTYAAALPLVADENSRIHTDFKQTLTATGRLSSADPNLQNIPIRTKMGREMRRYFIAEEGYTLVDADYSQIELRLLAHISEDYNMTEAFKSGEDIHKKTAAAVFGIPEESVNDDMRKRAKAVNFGIVYGISGFSLAKDIGTTTAVASQYIKSYLYNYPMVDAYLEKVVKDATEKGYTVTPMGRRRYIPELNAQNGTLRAFGKRVAMNAPIQGAAADIMKLAMINVNKALQKSGIDARIVMQVHDELIVEVLERDRDICMEIVKREMENAAKLSLPLTVSVSHGKNWLEQN
ncbi:MAG: DNA polymerase I [Ruminococcaceae bacterium]|nr:DNA polymerase I [Oscillospiraceae bacterium]